MGLRTRITVVARERASTAAAVAISPVVGLTTLLAQKLLRNPLGQMFAFEYGISGSWTDPKVEKLTPMPAPPKPPTGD